MGVVGMRGDLRDGRVDLDVDESAPLADGVDHRVRLLLGGETGQRSSGQRDENDSGLADGEVVAESGAPSVEVGVHDRVVPNRQTRQMLIELDDLNLEVGEKFGDLVVVINDCVDLAATAARYETGLVSHDLVDLPGPGRRPSWSSMNRSTSSGRAPVDSTMLAIEAL